MTGLPPTLITAGIPTELHVYPGLTHAQKPGAYVVNQMKEMYGVYIQWRDLILLIA
jgi:hypothetical protein